MAKQNNTTIWIIGIIFLVVFFILAKQGVFAPKIQTQATATQPVQQTPKQTIFSTCSQVCSEQDFDFGYSKSGDCASGETKVTYGYTGQTPLLTCCCYNREAETKECSSIFPTTESDCSKGTCEVGVCTWHYPASEGLPGYCYCKEEEKVCVDSDGDNIFTFGWVDDVALSVSYPDECYDSTSVIEYVCDPLPVAKMPQTCPSGYYCSGGRCIEWGFSIGDIVGGGSDTDTLLAGDSEANWVYDLSSIPVGGPCRLGARIHTDWNYVNPQNCYHTAYGYEIIEWNFYDSDSWVWGQVDYNPTTHDLDFCPLDWDGVNDWKLEMFKVYNMPNCDIEYAVSVEIYVCECD